MSTQPDPQMPGRKRRWLVRLACGCLLLVSLLVAGSVGGAFWVKGRELAAPDWLHERVEARLGEVLPNAQINIGSIAAVLGQDWRPRFSVRNVDFKTPEGAEIISFSDVRGELNNSALLERRLLLETLEVSGVFVTLRRNSDGQLSLSSGTNGGGVSRQSSNLAALIDDLDDLLLQPGLAELKDVDVDAVTLRYEDERADRAWTIDGGRLRMDRRDNDIQLAADLAILGGGAQVATLAANYAGLIGAKASDFGVTIADLDARDIASQSPAFSWLRALDAPISGALRGGVSEDGSFKPLNATLQIGAGVIQPRAEASPIPIDGARSYFTYLPDTQELRFDEMSVQSKWGSGRLEGQAALAAGKNGTLEDLVGQFRLTNLRVNPADFYPEPVNVEAAEMDFRLTVAPFALEIGRLEIADQGQMLAGKATVSADAEGWEISADAKMDALSTNRLLELWPARVSPKSRKWIDENIFAGVMKDISGSLRARQGEAPRTYLGFDFNKADVRYVKTLPWIKDGKGHATLIENRLVVVLDEGGVTAPEGGFVDASGTSFIIPDVKAKPDPPAIVRLIANGSATAVLSMLDQEPLRVMQRAKQPVDLAQGAISAQGTLSFPLKKKPPLQDFEFDVTAVATDVQTDVLVKGRVMAAPQLSIIASETEVAVAGLGTLDGVPVDVTWRQPIGAPGESPPSSVTGAVKLNQETLDAFNIALPPGSVQGEAWARVAIDLVKDTAPVLTLTSDLVGIRLAAPPINWVKGANTKGALDVVVRLGAAPTVERLSLTAPGLNAQGTLTLTDAGQLDRLRLSRVAVGNWFNGPVDLVGRGAEVPPRVVLRGGTLDLRRADFGRSRANSGNTPLDVSLDRLQVSDTISITDIRGQFSTRGGLAGKFEGVVNGAAGVTGELIPQGARSSIRVQSPDAGRVFAASGLLRQARGGRMELLLNPVGTGGAFDGTLKVSDARIKDAPAIAALLNAISIVGLVNELNGDGIFFDEINADFRLAPAQITIREASAVGASMGLSMDGLFVPDTGQLQMQGVITPVYLLNGIGSVLTRRGEGVFGFNYSIEGTATNPDVYVNPLTALAPAMFRNLFRRAAPEAPLEEGETRVEPAPRKRPAVTRGEDR